MATPKKPSKDIIRRLEVENRELTHKLRGQIAQCNRHFERAKLLEVENRELKAVLKEHGIEFTSRVNTLSVHSHKARFMKLANEHGMANVRIRAGQIEQRMEDGEWAVV